MSGIVKWFYYLTGLVYSLYRAIISLIEYNLTLLKGKCQFKECIQAKLRKTLVMQCFHYREKNIN